MGRRVDPAWSKGIVGLTAARERGDVDREFQSRLTVTRHMIERLGLETELKGHTGCVNCLEWNRDGSVLASASDDLHVILWDPFRYKQIHDIATGHTGNIFSVKFLSSENIATCAADGTVRVRSICGGETLLECGCHCGRVKRLATAPDNPNLMWSAAEDGLILQHDLRTGHRCNTNASNVLINLLNYIGRYAEAKCVAVNPRRPHQLAVGANDCYVRLYDTRMIKLSKLQSNTSSPRRTWERENYRCARPGSGDPESSIPRSAIQYFAPGHLSTELNESMFPRRAVTYVAFSHDGNELLVNLGSEQVYLFDVNSSQRPTIVESFIIQHNRGCQEEGDKRPKSITNGTVDYPQLLPEKIEQIKGMANEEVNRGNYISAVDFYNTAIGECPDCAILYSNRAAALMKRGWAGDTYAAIRDCYKAIELDPSHVKSHFRLAKCLMDVKRAQDANECLRYFKNKFPKHASSHAVCLLQKDINVALEKENDPEYQSDEGTGDEEEVGASRGAGRGVSALERQLRARAVDHAARFLGHCNTTTDIKEVNFLGPESAYLAAGSDDGSIFIWCRRTGNIVRCLRGDESIVNCIQMHPSAFLVATSGIEAVVRLWSPRPEDGSEDNRVVRNSGSAALANQQRMRSDPFEAMLLNISFAGAGPDRDMHASASASASACRPT